VRSPTINEGDQRPSSHVAGDRRGRRYLTHPVIRGGIARIVTLPVTALASFATAALTLRAVGAGSYGYIALLASLAALIPFADLGLGAAVQSAAAVARTSSPGELERVLLSAWRLLLASAALVAVGGVAVAASIGWAGILGTPRGGHIQVDLVVPAILVLFAASLPFGVGVRILVGLERNGTAVTIAAIGPLLALGAVLVMSHVGVPIAAYAVVQPAAILLTSMVTLAVAIRVSKIPALRVAKNALHPVAHRGASVAATAGPMFIVMIGLPIALQSDRLILSHQSNAINLTEYAVAAQVYATAWSVVYSAGISLWPRFARGAAVGEALRRPWTLALRGFGLTGVVVAIVLVTALPVIARILSGGTVGVPMSLAYAFGALMIAQSIHLPSAMLLTSPGQLRFQARCVFAMVILNLPLSWWLAGSIGAAGPVVGSAVAISLSQLLPGWLLARRITSENSSQSAVAHPSLPSVAR
jgi:O-antigen/teichoic acid export membrane protein